MSDVNTMINSMVEKGHTALSNMSDFSQEKVDHIVHQMVLAGLASSKELGQMAYDETGRGVAHDKALKNIFSTGEIWHSIQHHKTVGVVSEDKGKKLIKIARPLGVIAGITPVTNPTSTTMFNAIIAMKTRNPIIFSFHPQAMKSSTKAGEIMRDAAIKAGAPANSIQWITQPSIEATNELINNSGIATTLATGGPAMVKAAYSTGKPALGVGPANGPLYVERTADLDQAASDLATSKTFDNGMICATENSVIIDQGIYDDFKKKLQQHGFYFIKPEDQTKLAKTMYNPKTKSVNGPIAGQSAIKIAKDAGIKVPDDTKVLAAELDGVGPDYVLSGEKLSPVISVYKSKDHHEAFRIADELLNYGGLGHTAAICTTNSDIAKQFGIHMKACRVLVNMPASLGGVGGLFNDLTPSLTLGTGSWGKNSIDHNVTDYDLLNYSYVTGREESTAWKQLVQKYAE
ncbi:hypothetical protein WR164_02350 [Philodulcilactobacillus myokoensis]|uniref:Aldehyde dehydrogenase domain-containing protein n=1 Tax=Philodulcilactobacillus myokoensis TaxID=2929573 RepID=A0A9W6AZX6_9LACO|nr:hypothetical protein WR164_02350 [Philodulcilactobacillus myokoensis]